MHYSRAMRFDEEDPKPPSPLFRARVVSPDRDPKEPSPVRGHAKSMHSRELLESSERNYAANDHLDRHVHV